LDKNITVIIAIPSTTENRVPMAKTLYLMRHAQSVEKQAGQSDLDRELTPVGEKETFRMGAYLHREKINPDVIYTSSAVRAHATAKLLSDVIRFDVERIIPDEELAQASVRTFLEFITQLDDAYTSVMCIGHNPVISYVAEYLTGAEIGTLPTAGLVAMKLRVDSWQKADKACADVIFTTSPAAIEGEQE